MTTVWPSRRLRFGRSRRDRRDLDDGRMRSRRPSGVPRAAEHGNGTASCERKTDLSVTRRMVPPVSGARAGSRTRCHWEIEKGVACRTRAGGTSGGRAHRCSIIHHWASSDACSATASVDFLRRRFISSTIQPICGEGDGDEEHAVRICSGGRHDLASLAGHVPGYGDQVLESHRSTVHINDGLEGN